MLDLARHDRARDAFGAKGLDQAGEFAEGEPVDVDVGIGFSAGIDLGVGLLLDCGDDDFETMGACRVEEQERETAVACNEAKLFELCGQGHERWPKVYFCVAEGGLK